MSFSPLILHFETGLFLLFFFQEEDFEWGNPQNKSLSKVKLSDVEDALARAAHRWRSLIASGRSKGAFENFCCKVYATDDGKASAFERLISAGGGKVLPATLVFLIFVVFILIK